LRIAKLLEKLNPDVVALQEIDENSTWAGSFDQLEFLRGVRRFSSRRLGINNRRTGLLKLNYGNAILSKHRSRSGKTSRLAKNVWVKKVFYLPRSMCMGGVFRSSTCTCTTDRVRTGFARVEQVMTYLNRKQPLRRAHWAVPPIVCGDFNNPSHTADATASLFRYFSQRGHYSLHPRRGRTFPSPLPQRTLDFIFLPPGCVEVYCLVVRSMLSDHRPVMVECKLP